MCVCLFHSFILCRLFAISANKYSVPQYTFLFKSCVHMYLLKHYFPLHQIVSNTEECKYFKKSNAQKDTLTCPPELESMVIAEEALCYFILTNALKSDLKSEIGNPAIKHLLVQFKQRHLRMRIHLAKLSS